MEPGQRVQLKFLHKPIGTITSVIDGFTMNGVVFIDLSYRVQWDDGSVGESVRGNELEAIGVDCKQEITTWNESTFTNSRFIVVDKAISNQHLSPQRKKLKI